MTSVELSAFLADFVAAVSHVEETGERVSCTDAGEPKAVLVSASELAELEHFAQQMYAGRRPRPTTARKNSLGPVSQGPYTRYLHVDGVRTTFVRGHAVVAELKSLEEIDWLERNARMGRQGYMDPKQAAAFAEFLARQPPVGDGIAWIAGSWHQQQPFTVLEFIKGRTCEEVALAYGADPQDVADGLLLHQVRERDEREGTEDADRVLVFGEAGGWTWLGYHDFDHAFARRLDPPPSEQITLTATAAKAIYTFCYSKDGEYQNPYSFDDGVDEQPDKYELIWYTPGEPPFTPDAPLGFLSPHIRRAEENTEWTDGIALFFAGLERAFGVSLPEDGITSGNVCCARPAGRAG